MKLMQWLYGQHGNDICVVSADTFIYDRYKYNNYSNHTSLAVKKAITNYNRRTFLHFKCENKTYNTLILYVVGSSSSFQTPQEIVIQQCAIPINISTITWNNQSNYSGYFTEIGRKTYTYRPEYIEIPITPVTGEVYIRMMQISSNKNGFYFSKENSINKPPILKNT